MSRMEADEGGDEAVELARHRAEVRTLIRMRVEKGAHWLRGWLADARVAGRRAALERDIGAQWARGNRGQGWMDSMALGAQAAPGKDG